GCARSRKSYVSICPSAVTVIRPEPHRKCKSGLFGASSGSGACFAAMTRTQRSRAPRQLRRCLPGECADRNNARVRDAARGDFDAVVETITTAFHGDPVWSWAFPSADDRPSQFTQWWGLFVGSALERLWVPVTEDCAAVALWVPPGALELT